MRIKDFEPEPDPIDREKYKPYVTAETAKVRFRKEDEYEAAMQSWPEDDEDLNEQEPH